MLDKYNLHTASSLPSLQSETPSQTKPLSTQNFLSWHSNSVVGSAQTENEKKEKDIISTYSATQINKQILKL